MISVPEYCKILIEANRAEYYQSLAHYLRSYLKQAG